VHANCNLSFVVKNEEVVKVTGCHVYFNQYNADGPHDVDSRKIDHIALPGNERQSITNCYADRELSVITTCDSAQSPLNRFVFYMLYKQVCNKHKRTVTNGTDGA